MSPTEAQRILNFAISKAISDALRTLIQDKHLYQSQKIEVGDIQPTLDDVPKVTVENVLMSYQKSLHGWWSPGSNPDNGGQPICFVVPHVKIYCTKCDRIEAFNPSNQQVPISEPIISGKATIQVFSFCFVCQSCKGSQEIFLIRRDGMKLTLSGRSPIENVNVPSVIPKEIKNFFSGAIVAHQCGQTLAANFLLRTAIEQFVRGKAKNKDKKADTILTEYKKSLPNDFRKRFPSLSDIYSNQLSKDIHDATGSVEVFIKARAEILEHFEARRLYKLD